MKNNQNFKIIYFFLIIFLNSKTIQYLNQQKKGVTTVEYIENKIGLGTFAKVGDLKVLMGSRKLLQQYQILLNEAPESSGVYIAINGVYKGMFKMNHQYRKARSMIVIINFQAACVYR